ncbi:MAG: aldo/keto reductase [Chthoniobacterales bacterium]|jgi:diketogulonate reductase-like aldo/keto reductase
MKAVRLPGETVVPAIGQGTWMMGKGQRSRVEEVDALRLGIDFGLTLIDTAEMYGEGAAEEVVADAIAGQRDRVFLVTKVYPQNATRSGLPQACARSLKRLRTDVIDLYLLHWRGRTPLDETVEAFEKLREEGRIRLWGVSNFDLADLQELDRPDCAANQILYNLEARGIEFDLLPWCRERDLPVMAYSPIGQGAGMLGHRTLKQVAQRHDATPAQIALAWVLRQPQVIAIPKAGNPDHVRANAAAANLQLAGQDLADLDLVFPPPLKKEPLAML